MPTSKDQPLNGADAEELHPGGEDATNSDADYDPLPEEPTTVSAPPSGFGGASPAAVVSPFATPGGKPADVIPIKSDAKLNKLKSLQLGGDAGEKTSPIPKKRKSRWPYVVVGLIVGAGVIGVVKADKLKAALRAYLGAGPGGDPNRPPMRFFVAEMVTKETPAFTSAGYISADSFTMGATTSGRVDKVLVTEGQTVKRGQLLLQLDDSQIRADMRVAQAKAGALARNMKRMKELLKAEAVTQLDFEKARGDADLAISEVSAFGPKLASMQVRAPLDATVSEVLVRPGESISTAAGATAGVIRLSDLSRLVVETDVNETDVANVHVGDRTEVVVESFPDKAFKGTVKIVSPTADRTKGTVKVTVGVQADPKLRPGMSAKIRFQGSGAAPVPRLLVPKEAVVNGIVWKVVDGKAHRQQVTAQGAGSDVEITQGLKPGERIIASGFDGLAEGDAVNVNPPNPG